MPLPAPSPIPLFALQTQREKIIDRIIQYLLAIETVGMAVDLAVDGHEDVETIGEVVADGRFAIELLAGQDESLRDRTGDVLGWECFEMPVLLLVHLPKISGKLPYQAAAQICATVYKIVHSDQDPAGTWDGLAIQTRWDSGTNGAEVFADPRTQQPACVMEFSVSYRHPVGRPEGVS